jgi:hypothetical protein
MAKYIKSSTIPVRIAETLPLPDPQIPHIEKKLHKIKGKVGNLLSSPSRAEFESFRRRTISLLGESELVQFERDTLYRRLEYHTKRALYNRNRLQRGGQLIGVYI